MRWLRGLKQSAARREEGLAVAEGPKAVEELLFAADQVECLFWCETGSGEAARLALEFSRAGAPVEEMSPTVLAAAADTRTPQGVIAVVRVAPTPMGDLLAASGDMLLLDGVQDPGNVGTLIRSAEAAGAAGVILLDGSADPTGAKAVRAAAGSVFRLPWLRWTGPLDDLADTLRKNGRPVAIATADGAVSPAEAAAHGAVCWVVGTEGAGVSDGLRRCADLTVSLPMSGGVDSLNAAVAGSLLLYTRNLQARPAH
ncbi:MAG: TrmH family RNA methyltransferase [Leptospirillia bacterium]